MPASAATFANAFRTKFAPNIRENVNNKTVLLRMLEKVAPERFTPEGDAFYIQMRSEETQGYAALGESASAFPESGNVQYQRASVAVAFLFHAIKVPDTLIKRAQTNAGAVVKPLKDEMDSAERNLKKQINRQLLGDGTGKLATVSAFSDEGGSGTNDLVTVDTTKHIKVGAKIDFYRSGSGVTNATGCTVASRNSATQFEVSAITGTPAADDIVVYADSYDNEIHGLKKLITTDTTVQGVDRATNEWWQCNVNTNGGSLDEFSLKNFNQVFDDIETRSGDPPDFCLCAPETYSAAAWVLLPDRRFANDEIWEGYWHAVEFHGCKIVKEPDSPANEVFLLQKRGLAKGVLWDIDFFEGKGGNILQLAIDSSTSRYAPYWEAFLGTYMNLALTESYGQGRYTNVYGLYDAGASYLDAGGWT